jgi:hypothetical protein
MSNSASARAVGTGLTRARYVSERAVAIVIGPVVPCFRAAEAELGGGIEVPRGPFVGSGRIVAESMTGMALP